MWIKIMAVSRILIPTFFIVLAASGVTRAQNAASTLDDDLQEIRSRLVDRLSPTEAILLERIDGIEQKLEKDNPWLGPPVVLALALAAAGWIIAVFQLYVNRRQRIWELLLESLRWFEGGTQPRSIGIALVESKWEYHEEFRSRWASILVNQAIYLLTRQKDRDAIHERANLYRIMNLLIETVDPSEPIVDFERELLCETLQRYPRSERGLIDLDPERLKAWTEHFCLSEKKAV